MLKRDYQAPEFNVRDERRTPEGQVAAADTRSAAPITFGDSTWRDRMLQQLGGQGAQVLEKMADIEFSNLYLEGQAKAGIIESEAELEGNPLTRDWKVAGYRDTMGKLSLADSEAQFSVDIARLREAGPEEMQAYLTKRREKLMPALSGMSREARASAAGQLLLQDRSATKTYTTEHAKFIIEQKSQAVHSQWNTSMRTLGAAQARARLGETNPEDFQEQLRSTAGTMVGSVWMDSSLPDNVKQQLTFEMIQSTLANDSVELYDFLSQNEIPTADGGSSTLLSRLDAKQQLQLANGYREAQSRTNDQRNRYQMAAIANIESQIDNNTYTGSYADLDEVLSTQVMRKAITGERRATLLNKYLDEQYKGEEGSALFGMATRGDINGILNSGNTEKDAIDAVEATLAKAKASPEQRLNTYLEVGKNGLAGGFNRAGQVLGVSLRQIRSKDGTVLPQHMETFKVINDAVRSAEEGGNMNARMQLLSGLSEEDRMFATRVFAHVDGAGSGKGKSVDEAVALASEAEAREAEMSPSVRAARSQAVVKDVAAAVNAIEPLNLLETGWAYFKSIFSEDARSNLAISPRSNVSWQDGIMSDSPTVRLYADDVRQALDDEARRVMLVNPLETDPERVILTAKANLAARTVQTRHGPIVLPHRANASAIFGVSSANLPMVGPAIDKMLQETKKDAKWHVQFRHNGVFVQEYDRNGTAIGTGNYLDKGAVRESVRELMKDKRETAGFRYGVGKEVRVGDTSLRYSGESKSGNPASWMLEFRDNLVKSEGITNKVAPDLSGRKDKSGKEITTTGVGVSSHNPHAPKAGPDGTVSPEEIRRSFLGASDDAAAAGRRVASSLGMADNKPAFMLMSEIAYQSGTGFLSQQNKTGDSYRMFAQALQSGDTEAAKAAFKQTAAWYYSVDPKKRSATNMDLTERRKHYLNLIEQSTQGG